MVYCFQVRFNFQSFIILFARRKGHKKGNFAFRLKGLATFQCISSSFFFLFLCFLHLPALYVVFLLLTLLIFLFLSFSASFPLFFSLPFKTALFQNEGNVLCLQTGFSQALSFFASLGSRL